MAAPKFESIEAIRARRALRAKQREYGYVSKEASAARKVWNAIVERDEKADK